MSRRRHAGLALVAALALALPCPRDARAQDLECLDCHGAGDADGMDPSHVVDEESWSASVHADLGFECVDCHAGKAEFPHEDGEPTLCAECHEDAADDVGRSVHADSDGAHVMAGVGLCAPCHGVHDARAADDPGSRVHVRNVTATCGVCHGDTGIAGSKGLSTAPFTSFRESVHGSTSVDDEARLAVCTACHGSHLIVRASDPASSINPFRIAETCGACHPVAAEQYTASVHGRAFQRGVTAAPTCTDCHGIHAIKHVPPEGVSTTEKRLVRSTCVACHSSAALMAEYGPSPARVSSYDASYHGLALQRGTTAVADCASCHGIHAIYPSDDPRSSVAAANLDQTCGNCHPGAGIEFTRSPVHFVSGDGSFQVKVVDVVTNVYRAFIVIVIGAMLLHNAVIVAYYVRRKMREDRREQSLPRFSTAQIVQHTLLLVSFLVLAVTGFTLAYPDIWWSRWLLAVGLTEPVRRWSHRIAAIVLVGSAIYHVIWLRMTSYGRSETVRILPRRADVRELAGNMKFHLGFSDRLPEAGKYGYAEKVEYWAVVWGTAVMAVTGAILWVPVAATTFLPGWVIKVSEVVHLYEAWLATLAIVVFHFFYVMGHPGVYPLSLSMFTGRISRHEAELRHPQWAAEVEEHDGEAEDGDRSSE